MKKYRIIIAITAVCLALCAAVWLRTEVVEETPTPFQVSVVSDPEPTVEDIATKVEAPLPAEGEKIEIPQAEPLDEIIQGHPFRHKQLLVRSQETWSMSQASAGWNAKTPARSFTTKIYMKTAIRLVSWDSLKNCAA